MTDGRTDRQTDEQTDSRTDGQTDGQSDYYRAPPTSSVGALMMPCLLSKSSIPITEVSIRRGTFGLLPFIYHYDYLFVYLIMQVFQRKTLVIKMINVGRRFGGRHQLVFGALTPQPFEKFEWYLVGLKNKSMQSVA